MGWSLVLIAIHRDSAWLLQRILNWLTLLVDLVSWALSFLSLSLSSWGYERMRTEVTSPPLLHREGREEVKLYAGPLRYVTALGRYIFLSFYLCLSLSACVCLSPSIPVQLVLYVWLGCYPNRLCHFALYKVAYNCHLAYPLSHDGLMDSNYLTSGVLQKQWNMITIERTNERKN